MSKHARKLALATAVSLALGAGVSGCHRNTPESLMADAKQYEQKGDFKSAVIQLKNAVEKDSENAEVRFQLADVYLQSGDFPSAEKEIRKAMSLGLPAERTVPVLAHAMEGQGDNRPRPSQAVACKEAEVNNQALS